MIQKVLFHISLQNNYAYYSTLFKQNSGMPLNCEVIQIIFHPDNGTIRTHKLFGMRLDYIFSVFRNTMHILLCLQSQPITSKNYITVLILIVGL